MNTEFFRCIRAIAAVGAGREGHFERRSKRLALWPRRRYIAVMRTVGIRTLKNRLSEYLRVAQSGERITVTSRGAPVADLVPHAPHGLDPDDELLRLARVGEVRLGASNPRVRYTRPPAGSRLPHDDSRSLGWPMSCLNRR